MCLFERVSGIRRARVGVSPLPLVLARRGPGRLAARRSFPLAFTTGVLEMRFALFGLLVAAVIFVISGGHVLFLPLFFLLPLGGLFGHRRRRSRRF